MCRVFDCIAFETFVRLCWKFWNCFVQVFSTRCAPFPLRLKAGRRRGPWGRWCPRKARWGWWCRTGSSGAWSGWRWYLQVNRSIGQVMSRSRGSSARTSGLETWNSGTKRKKAREKRNIYVPNDHHICRIYVPYDKAYMTGFCQICQTWFICWPYMAQIWPIYQPNGSSSCPTYMDTVSHIWWPLGNHKGHICNHH